MKAIVFLLTCLAVQCASGVSPHEYIAPVKERHLIFDDNSEITEEPADACESSAICNNIDSDDDDRGMHESIVLIDVTSPFWTWSHWNNGTDQIDVEHAHLFQEIVCKDFVAGINQYKHMENAIYVFESERSLDQIWLQCTDFESPEKKRRVFLRDFFAESTQPSVLTAVTCALNNRCQRNVKHVLLTNPYHYMHDDLSRVIEKYASDAADFIFQGTIPYASACNGICAGSLMINKKVAAAAGIVGNNETTVTRHVDSGMVYIAANQRALSVLEAAVFIQTHMDMHWAYSLAVCVSRSIKDKVARVEIIEPGTWIADSVSTTLIVGGSRALSESAAERAEVPVKSAIESSRKSASTRKASSSKTRQSNAVLIVDVNPWRHLHYHGATGAFYTFFDEFIVKRHALARMLCRGSNEDGATSVYCLRANELFLQEKTPEKAALYVAIDLKSNFAASSPYELARLTYDAVRLLDDLSVCRDNPMRCGIVAPETLASALMEYDPLNLSQYTKSAKIPDYHDAASQVSYYHMLLTALAQSVKSSSSSAAVLVDNRGSRKEHNDDNATYMDSLISYVFKKIAQKPDKLHDHVSLSANGGGGGGSGAEKTTSTAEKYSKYIRNMPLKYSDSGFAFTDLLDVSPYRVLTTHLRAQRLIYVTVTNSVSATATAFEEVWPHKRDDDDIVINSLIADINAAAAATTVNAAEHRTIDTVFSQAVKTFHDDYYHRATKMLSSNNNASGGSRTRQACAFIDSAPEKLQWRKKLDKALPSTTWFALSAFGRAMSLGDSNKQQKQQQYDPLTVLEVDQHAGKHTILSSLWNQAQDHILWSFAQIYHCYSVSHDIPVYGPSDFKKQPDKAFQLLACSYLLNCTVESTGGGGGGGS